MEKKKLTPHDIHTALMKKQAFARAVRFNSHRAGITHYLPPRKLNSVRG